MTTYRQIAQPAEFTHDPVEAARLRDHYAKARAPEPTPAGWTITLGIAEVEDPTVERRIYRVNEMRRLRIRTWSTANPISFVEDRELEDADAERFPRAVAYWQYELARGPQPLTIPVPLPGESAVSILKPGDIVASYHGGSHVVQPRQTAYQEIEQASARVPMSLADAARMNLAKEAALKQSLRNS